MARQGRRVRSARVPGCSARATRSSARVPRCRRSLASARGTSAWLLGKSDEVVGESAAVPGRSCIGTRHECRGSRRSFPDSPLSCPRPPVSCPAPPLSCRVHARQHCVIIDSCLVAQWRGVFFRMALKRTGTEARSTRRREPSRTSVGRGIPGVGCSARVFRPSQPLRPYLLKFVEMKHHELCDCRIR